MTTQMLNARRMLIEAGYEQTHAVVAGPASGLHFLRARDGAEVILRRGGLVVAGLFCAFTASGEFRLVAA